MARIDCMTAALVVGLFILNLHCCRLTLNPYITLIRLKTFYQFCYESSIIGLSQPKIESLLKCYC